MKKIYLVEWEPRKNEKLICTDCFETLEEAEKLRDHLIKNSDGNKNVARIFIHHLYDKFYYGEIAQEEEPSNDECVSFEC